ncbi:beta-galactosidase [Bacillus sp. JCM 19041]|uniref:beta-galactosidase n=1 Tax=Bacillus sp. JCM 19041 TaxID=1460637 RepID=UPI0006D0E20A
MVEIKEKNIYIDGEPQLILCGEIHYFRLEKTEWQDRINKLKAAGCNAVATYVPWICHEPIEGNLDLMGKTRPELDLVGYIDLCHQNGLYFIIKPGPFIMAEMKNEGLPYWVYEKHSEIKPIGWDGALGPTPTVDYTHPHFLMEVERWYESVMSVVAPRLFQFGGPIIAVQLDNEVGMLDWVSNTPDLTDDVIASFTNWLNATYGVGELNKRYPCELTTSAIRSPDDSYATVLHMDLGHFMRNRFAKYIEKLREYAETNGVSGIPFIVNIHGTGGGRGFTFPIGISQLYESYTQAPGTFQVGYLFW